MTDTRYENNTFTEGAKVYWLNVTKDFVEITLHSIEFEKDNLFKLKGVDEFVSEDSLVLVNHSNRLFSDMKHNLEYKFNIAVCKFRHLNDYRVSESSSDNILLIMDTNSSYARVYQRKLIGHTLDDKSYIIIDDEGVYHTFQKYKCCFASNFLGSPAHLNNFLYSISGDYHGLTSLEPFDFN